MRAAVYCRISQDRVGAGLGVARQQQDCLELAATRGWQVFAVYEDNDVSAYNGNRREGYQKLLHDIRAGLVDIVIAWHTDRLHRSPTELEEYISACEKLDVSTVTVRAGELDLSTAAGRMVARMLGAAARHESEQKSERISRARAQEARLGLAHGNLGYGWRKAPLHEGPSAWTIDEEEASVIREIAARLLAGDTLSGIARDLNARAVPTPSGLTGAWRAVNIRAMIMAARYCGWREWTPAAEPHGRGRSRGMGTLVAAGNWPAIIDRATTERLRLLLSDPARKSGGRPGRATYLLSAGLARCGRCGANLAGHADARRGTRRYDCPAQPGLRRCGRLTISSDALDAFVTEALLQVLTETARTPLARPIQDSDTVDEATRLRGRLDELADLYASEAITRAEWLTARSGIEKRLTAAEANIRTDSRRLTLQGLPTNRKAMEKRWQTMSLEQRRATASAVLDRVVVHPASHGGNRLDPGRVELIWRA